MRDQLGHAAVVGAMLAWASVIQAAADLPRFEPGACPSSVEETADTTCGTLVVPESRARPSDRTVRLAVAVVHAPTSGDGSDPLLYLAGGPGYAALPNASHLRTLPFVADRDLVLLDVRGTGASTPSLACPEVDGRILLAAPAYDRRARRRYRAAAKACRRRLRAAGIDLRAYDYTEMAADLADLRRALGIARWSAYGISNGGRLALELVRRHPEGIVSLVLDAALAPDGNFYLELWPHAQRAFDALFADCAADAACDGAHPDLERRFWDVVDRLRRDPVTVTVPDPASGARTTVVLDDVLAVQALQGALYDSSLIPLLPVLIDLLDSGAGYDAVATAILDQQDGPARYSLGQNLSVNCREEVAFLPRRAFAAQVRALPRLARVIADDPQRKLCSVWRVGRADASVDEPVASTVPALLLVGSLDPVHPRASSEAIARHLPNARLYELPGLGHGTVEVDACARGLMQAFLAEPTRALDASCVERGVRR